MIKYYQKTRGYMNHATNVIEIENLTKNFGKARGISNVDLKVKQGEIFGFLGPNGAGKTTTIRCIMNFIQPNSGTITVLGHDAQRDPVKIMAKTGFLSADPQLYDKWTGEHYLSFLASIKGKCDVSNLVKRLNLNMSVQFQNLSTGNKQKLALIVALYGSPDLIIMDEPTKGLDPLLQQEIYNILNEYRQRGGTVFLSSHNLPEVEKICDRVGVIRNGVIVANETMKSIREMAIHVVTISSNDVLRKKDFEINGVDIEHSSDKHLMLKIKGDLNPLLSIIHKYKIKDLEITHANLEDIFMEYYQ